MTMKIFAHNALIDGVFQPATIEVSGDVISHIEPGVLAATSAVDVRFDHGYVVPGLIDLQLNGVAGVDFSSGNREEIDTALAALPQTGTTSVCPTLITSKLSQILKQLSLFSELTRTSGSSRSLGVHLEGPVISQERRGAHALEHILSASEFLASGIDLDHIRILTLAPEIEGAAELIRLASERGILVSLGHTTATSSETKHAKSLGASMVTHLFNGMPKIHQREPGIVTAALLDDSMFFGLIVDGEHVNSEFVDLAFRLGADRAVIVSDASAALLSPPGQKIKLGGDVIVVSDRGLVKRKDGTLASSGLSQLEAIELQVRAGLSRELLLRSATQIPADLMGEPRLGRLETGAYADLVHYQVDPVLEVDLVLISGEKCRL
jgi:N-acetylglucosamine-6-phosphate deacetylase